MNALHVTPLAHLDAVLAQSGARWMASFSAPGKALEMPAQVDGGFLALEFNDIARPLEGMVAPDSQHISQFIHFARQWNQQGPLVLQCWMGVSRSTAAALIAAVAYRPEIDLERLTLALRKAAPHATPNALMISLADEQLGLGGRLSAAVSAIGRGSDGSYAPAFSLDLEALK